MVMQSAVLCYTCVYPRALNYLATHAPPPRHVRGLVSDKPRTCSNCGFAIPTGQGFVYVCGDEPIDNEADLHRQCYSRAVEAGCPGRVDSKGEPQNKQQVRSVIYRTIASAFHACRLWRARARRNGGVKRGAGSAPEPAKTIAQLTQYIAAAQVSPHSLSGRVELAVEAIDELCAELPKDGVMIKRLPEMVSPGVRIATIQTLEGGEIDLIERWRV